METSLGMEASKPYSWCARPGTKHACMIPRELSPGDQVVCAYCKRNGKAGCSVMHPDQKEPTPQPPKDKFKAIELRVQALESRPASSDERRKDSFAAMGERLQALERKPTSADTSRKDRSATLESRLRAPENRPGIAHDRLAALELCLRVAEKQATAPRHKRSAWVESRRWLL